MHSIFFLVISIANWSYTIKGLIFFTWRFVDVIRLVLYSFSSEMTLNFFQCIEQGINESGTAPVAAA